MEALQQSHYYYSKRKMSQLGLDRPAYYYN